MLILLCVSLLALPLAQAITNIFHTTNSVWANVAHGEIHFNDSEYNPTCGWKLILSSGYPLDTVTVYGGLTDGLDNYTFIISNDVSHAATNEIVLAVVIQGSFGNTFPPIMVNVFCVCNSTSSGLCQGVPYETIPRTNQNVTSSPPSSQPLAISSFYSSFLSAVSCKTKLTEVESSCYTGADYLVLKPVSHFVDCCSLCCNYQRCLGLNFHPAGKRCDLVLEPAAPTSLGSLAGCQFWNNTLST